MFTYPMGSQITLVGAFTGWLVALSIGCLAGRYAFPACDQAATVTTPTAVLALVDSSESRSVPVPPVVIPEAPARIRTRGSVRPSIDTATGDTVLMSQEFEAHLDEVTPDGDTVITTFVSHPPQFLGTQIRRSPLEVTTPTRLVFVDRPVDRPLWERLGENMAFMGAGYLVRAITEPDCPTVVSAASAPPSQPFDRLSIITLKVSF